MDNKCEHKNWVHFLNGWKFCHDCKKPFCGEPAPTPVQGKEWCRHITYSDAKVGGHWVFDFTGGEQMLWNKWDADVYKFQFCPICAAPRPKEKTLEEKFIERLSGYVIDGHKIEKGFRYNLIEQLAVIAHAHFNTEGGG